MSAAGDPGRGPSAVRDAPGAPRVAPRRYGGARIALCKVLERGCARLGGRAFYRRRSLAPGRFRVRRETVAVPGLPPGLEGFRVAQLSDLHAGPFLGEGDLAPVVAAANALEPDACALTGDFITSRWDEALLVLADCAALESRHGTFAVFGNHDYHGRREDLIEAAFQSAGIRFLRNRCARIETGAGALALVGLEDLEESRRIDLAGARAGVRPGDVELVLCHNPAAAAELARPGCAAILAGHTHGGQIDLPLARRLGPPHPGDRLGLGSTQLIVSRGLGALVLPLRVRSPAEVVLVELRRGGEPVAG